jgi:hypothetical protein
LSDEVRARSIRERGTLPALRLGVEAVREVGALHDAEDGGAGDADEGADEETDEECH